MSCELNTSADSEHWTLDTDILIHQRGVDAKIRSAAQGLLAVSYTHLDVYKRQAKDKATGKENRIVIKASSGLSEAEIKRMIGDAEAHAEEDKKFHELVNARNQAENLIHASEKTLRDLGDKVEGGERSAIEAAISDLRTTAKTDNKSAIEAKTRTLAELSGKLAERLYAQTGGGPEGGSGGPGGTGGGGHKPADDGVVDAEFEEVKK